MTASNIQIKVTMTRGENVAYETWHKVFNQWIPDPVDDVLIDVADYSHVKNGPVALLAGHNANYIVDATGGTLGFTYRRKKPLEGSFGERLDQALKAALQACRRLEDDPLVKDSIDFAGERIQIAVNDRLSAPNEEGTLRAVSDDVNASLQKLYGGASFTVSRVEEPRQRFTLNVSAEGSFKPAQMLENLVG